MFFLLFNYFDIIHINPSLGIGLINEGVRDLYDRSTAENLNTSKSVNGINIIDRIDTLSNTSDRRNNSVWSHRSDESRSSENSNRFTVTEAVAC